jgi:hypothetical protein
MPRYEMTLRMVSFAAGIRADVVRTNPTTGNLEFIDSVSSEEIGYYTHAEIAALWDVLVNSHEDYCIKRYPIHVKADIEDYSLPEDFYKFRKVFPLLSGKRGNALKKFDLNDLGASDSLAALLTSPIEDTRYKINGNRLWLHPVPTSSAELELWYVPQVDPVLNLDDVLPYNFPLGWEDYVVEGTAARIMEKKELDSSPFRARQKEILQRLLIMAEDRDVGEPHQMQDTEGYLDTWS